MKLNISKKLNKTYKELVEEYTKGNFGYSAIAILGQSCLGSIAIMLLLKNKELSRPVQFIELFLVTILYMAFNASVLSQQKSKTQFNILLLSLFGSFMILAFNAVA